MPTAKKILGLSVALSATSAAFAAEGGGVATSAETLFRLGPLPVTNSMVTSWIVAVVLIVVIRLAIKKPKLLPSHGQAVVETLVEGLRDLIAPIVGSKVAKPTFPLLIAFFTFILIQNWSGLVPGVGTIYMVDHETGGWMELIRPGNADMNGTLALSAVAITAWLYFIFRYAGPKAVIYDLFGNKADKRDVHAFIYYPLFVIFFGVGLLEIVSIIFRPVSLSFRLYGNIFGGENLMHAMSGMQKWGLPIPFYFMELLVGFVQAFVFTLLVSVYIGLICNHGDDHDEHAHTDKAASVAH
ncbi:MAG TPA: F0F1 ATP synthase subunit A [Lacunisphaera sp.]|jgi:F-type H+-transporting ATPase subunit a